MWFQRMVENQWNGKRSVLQCSSEQCRRKMVASVRFSSGEQINKQDGALIETLFGYNCRGGGIILLKHYMKLSENCRRRGSKGTSMQTSLNSIDNRLNESLHQIQRERENEIQSIEFKYEETVTKIQSDHSKVVREREKKIQEANATVKQREEELVGPTKKAKSENLIYEEEKALVRTERKKADESLRERHAAAKRSLELSEASHKQSRIDNLHDTETTFTNAKSECNSSFSSRSQLIHNDEKALDTIEPLLAKLLACKVGQWLGLQRRLLLLIPRHLLK